MSDKLREALEFYADAENYDRQHVALPCGCCSDWNDAKITTDEGERARAALAQPQNDAAVVPAMWQFRYRSIHGVWTAWLEGRPLHSDGLEIECRPLYTAPPSPELEPWRDELSEIIGHLGAAIIQSVASDDQTIMDHVKAAHEIAKIVRRKA
jgi:hypothetical protein